MKILITGGCGFLGSNLAADHLEAGHEVIVLDALLRAGGERNLSWLRSRPGCNGLKFERGDIAETAFVEQIFREHAPFDFVCHVGGQVAMTTSLTDPRRDMLTNVVGTFNVLEAVRAHSPEALVAYSSTNKVYGDLECLHYGESKTRYTLPDYPKGLDESLNLDFASPYGCSKGAADQYVRDWYRNYGIKTVVFRHSSIYGGRQFATFDQGWIGWFCTQAWAQFKDPAAAPFTIAGSGKQVRDVLHASDLVRLYRSAYEQRHQIAGQIFNIGGGMENSLSLLELFTLLEQKLKLDRPLQFIRTPRRKSDQDFFVADIGKARRLLDWSPQVPTAAGIDQMLNWIKSEA